MKINRKNDLEYITFDNLEQTGLVKHCFTTRHGGVSTDYWASMNMGFARGEKREPVLQNYKILADRVRYFKEDERGVEIMCREMEIMRNQAHEEGIEKGRIMQLIKQVCVKMQKFSSAEEVANDLVEQDVPLIQKIMNVAPDFAPDYNVNDIYNALKL